MFSSDGKRKFKISADFPFPRFKKDIQKKFES